MRISQIKIQNFRSYSDEVTVDIHDLTVFVGKNDVGKSTILEALDIFFNEGKGSAKLDKDDINKERLKSGDNEVVITVVFDELPNSVVIDTSNSTTLDNEYLLDTEGKLEIVKRYPNAGKEKVSIRAVHPSHEKCANLLLSKQSDLRKIIKDESIDCDDQRRNSLMRSLIWDHFSDELNPQLVEVDVSKEDAKNIWEQLKNYMPLYTLFQSDRKNSDGDSEVQDPMKLAVQEIMKDQEIVDTLDAIANQVGEKLQEVADRTLNKLREMNPDVANSLNPVIPLNSSLKWSDVFKNVSISGDDDIPINKRGSGVKRLVLLNFFRAEAERRRDQNNVPDIIYAIEEPETSQHPGHQKLLIEALIELSKSDNTQILLTTHSPSIVKLLSFDNLKLVKSSPSKEVVNIEEHNLPYPSLNEVNFIAFGESDDGYHNELYGFIESEGWMDEFKSGRPTFEYIKEFTNGSKKTFQKVKSEIIRHQIHHPENKENVRFTFEELQDSIIELRAFIVVKRSE